MNIEFLHILNLNKKNVIREIAFIVGVITICIENYIVLHEPWSYILITILYLKFISYCAPLIPMIMPIISYGNYVIMNSYLDVECKILLKVCWYAFGILIMYYNLNTRNRFNKKIHRLLNSS